MILSNRIQNMQFSPIRKLVPYAEEAKKKGVSVYHLNIGQPDIKTPETFIEGIRKYDDEVLKYANSQGIPELIESFIKYYKEWNIEFDNDEIIVTNGGSEALMFALMAICDYDDEVIIPEPFYTNYNGFSAVAGTKVVPVTTKAEEGFHLPSKEVIESKITDRTRAIMISNPGNPTGVVYSEEEVRMLADIVKEHDLFLISDEVYREFVYDGLKYTSALYMDDIVDRVILIDSVSKRYSACGARIGLVASKNKEIINQIMKLAQSRLCVPTVEQIACANLIKTPKAYFEEVLKEYETRRNILYKKLSEMPGVICKKPTGAFYVVAKLPVESGEDFAKWLLTDFNYQNKTVMIAPAEGFYATEGLGKDEIRISYCLNTTALEDAMNILGMALEKYISIKK
ncbi:aspartate aminotransferase [Clostridium tepidiprofundi DSM 19306]|uniref:Aminotransferase n=1 Tax=Clostridium tepidiprofundi DSM 19306 TaxID=1121338 RepID=A0A151B778_9CLOT|nr:pyridoxal phosphate-dependent aminotransferase [Clostridium tepidiprofundi]KYH35749.1 aspartate aminotransferase [Clostridium tepidiprofundi DSM 19306]